MYKRCGDNFEALPRHLSKLERSLDRTNYALISMGSDWYRQRLTHEDREMVDMASKYNPTPFPSTSKQSEFEMRKNAGFGRIIGNAIEEFRVELEKLDAEYIDGGDSWIAEDKQESLHSGDFEHALSLTRDHRVKEVIMAIQHRVDNYNRKGSAKRVAKMKFEDFLLDHIDELIKLDREFGDDSSDKSEALWSGDFEKAIKLTRNQRAKDYIQFLDNKFLVWSENLF